MKIAFYFSIVVCALVAAPGLRAQADTQPPKPGPEHQKLSYFAGRWTSTGEMKFGPMGPGGPVKTESTCEWFPGGFYLVCRGQGQGPAGETRNLGILGYSAERGRYSYYGIDNSGMGGDHAYGEVAGDTWTWESESMMGDQTVTSRYVMKQISPDQYSWRWEVSGEGGEWTLLGEGMEIRAK